MALSPTFGELWESIHPLFDDTDFLAAHNAAFDARILRGCCRHYKIPMPELNFTCTMQLARRTWRIYPTKLSDVCRSLKIPLQHHEALSDALACAKIVLAAYAPRGHENLAMPANIRQNC